MAPKKSIGSDIVYLVVISNTIDSVHASIQTASARSTEAKEKGKDNVRVEVQQLVGGTINIETSADNKKPTKSKTLKAENDDDAAKPGAIATAPVKKSKTPAEQRATNAAKPKGAKGPGDDDLPDNIKALLNGTGAQLDGLRIVVTGVPPVLGRKNAEKLVQVYGGNLTKSLSKNTDYVIVGNDAGPKKYMSFLQLGAETIARNTNIWSVGSRKSRNWA